MSSPRTGAWALIGVLVATLITAVGAQPALAAKDTSVCSPGQGPTLWSDQEHPPTSIRVLRTKGPSAGHVQTVDFWTYVGTVLRREYSTGETKPKVWMQVGALTVKQYGWYYALRWRGGKVSTTTTNPDGTTTTTVECYDVTDTTADQLYRPEETWPDGTVFKGSTPNPTNLRAMRETWHLSLRKWLKKKGKSKLFLTGYRSGKKVPCGSDAPGWKIKQKSMLDCGRKGMTFEEIIRVYFPAAYLVDTRTNDALTDGDAWHGDMGVLAPGGSGQTDWALYAGKIDPDTFAKPKANAFGTTFSAIAGYGTANVDAVDPNGADDARLANDLLMLTTNAKLLVAHANGNGYDAPSVTSLGIAADRLVVGDFDGDMLGDAGILRSNGNGTASLSVMFSRGDGTFSSPTGWWTGSLDLTDSSVYVAAADVNGDGKADLIVRDSAGVYSAAISPPSCSNLSTWGACPSAAVGGGLSSASVAAQPGWAAGDVKNVVGDYDRDGRDDILAIVKNGSGLKVFGLHAKADGTFSAPLLLFSSDSFAFGANIPVAINVNSDGMSDLALIQKNGNNGSSLLWLRSVERTKSAAAKMVAGTAYTDSGLDWSSGLAAY